MQQSWQYNKLKQLRLSIMKRIFLAFIALTCAVFAAAQQSGNPSPQPSLADLARQQRSQRKSAAIMHVDNETLKNSSGRLSTSGDDADSTNQASKTTDQAGGSNDADKKSVDGKASDNKDTATTSADKPKGEDWNAKIDARKKDIALLQRELDVLQREQRLRAAAYYADAGTQLRDPARFAEESRAQQEQIDSKKQSLDAAQQKLEELQEQARKAGIKAE